MKKVVRVKVMEEESNLGNLQITQDVDFLMGATSRFASFTVDSFCKVNLNQETNFLLEMGSTRRC